MDILSVAGFALNVYSYLQENPFNFVDEPTNQVVAEQITEESKLEDLTMLSLLPTEPRPAEENRVERNNIDLNAIERKSYPVSELLKEGQDNKAEAETAEPLQSKQVATKGSHLFIQKRAGKIISGLNPGGEYYFKRKSATQ